VSVTTIVGDVAAYTAIPFALIGFGATIWQTTKARNAAEAARDAAKAAQSSISRNSLLMLIPQLQRVEDELERAVQIESAELAITWLSSWRWQAGQVRGFLGRSSAENKRILRALQSSISMAAQVKSAIIDGSPDDLASITRSARKAIADVTNEIGALAATQGVQIGDIEGGN
jgi:hypothetical protein